MSEKTEQPTPRRLQEARKRGQVPRSRTFSGALVLLAGAFGLWLAADDGIVELRGWTVSLLSLEASDPRLELMNGLSRLASLALPTLLCALVGGLVAAVSTSGVQLSVEQVWVKLERLDPVAGLKRLWSMRTAVELGKGVLAGLVVAWSVGARTWASLSALLRTSHLDGGDALLEALHLVARAMARGGVVLALLGAVDLALSRRRHWRDLMMTRQEVKEEHKSSEGDPHHKAKRKAAHRQLAAGGQARGVQRATVVVVNPTHIAVALRYDPAECDAPYLVAKGQEADALRLRRFAEQERVPVVRDVPLARALVQYDIGEQIPEELYQAAAAVLQVALARLEVSAPGEVTP